MSFFDLSIILFKYLKNEVCSVASVSVYLNVVRRIQQTFALLPLYL